MRSTLDLLKFSDPDVYDAMAGASGPPPPEAVGLEPYDPRLLPLQQIPTSRPMEARR